VHTAKYAEVEETKKCHIDIYVKTKKLELPRAVKYWLNPVQNLFQAFNSLLRSFTRSKSLYFQAQTALR